VAVQEAEQSAVDVQGVGSVSPITTIPGCLLWARIAGGFVLAVDIEDHKLTMATELGADYVVNALTTDPVEAIQALGGADVAVALATSPGAFDQAYRSLRCGGRLVCVAPPADNATLSLPIFGTVISGKAVIGSIVSTRNELADVFALHAAGRTRVSPSAARSTASSPALSRPVSSSGSHRSSSEPPANCVFLAACPAEVSFSGQLADTMGGRRHYAGYEHMSDSVARNRR
jgi:D-arabinose 1-dehydrogenase-like Zn-dependent alcohol dehydrogenase